MPQFVKPAKGAPGSGASYLDTATSTFKAPSSGGGGGGGNSGGGSTPAPSGPTAAEKAAADRKKREAAAKKAAAKKAAAKAAAEEAARNKYNPLLASYLSPEEQLKQATNLAALGAPSEAALRAQGAQQVAGITGLTNALQSRLGALNTQNQAAIAGLGQTYKDIAAQTQSAGGSALAAAGAPTDLSAGGNPMVAANMANLTAQTAGLVPAAGAMGLGLGAQAQSNLTKALVERANKVSSDTAKYLKQIQDQEYTKATALETLKQNAALLGVKQGTLAQTAAYNDARIKNMQDKSALGWATLDAKIAKINADATKSADKKSQEIRDSILSSALSFTKPIKQLTGKKEYRVVWPGDKSGKKVYATSPQGAAWQLRNSMGDGDYKNAAYTATETGRQESKLMRPSRASVEAQIRSRLTNAGMTPAEIDAFFVTYGTGLGLDSLPA